MSDEVRKQSATVAEMAEDWALIDALMGGTKTMRRAGKRYLPQWPAEDNESYKDRLATATLFPAYERTVSVLTGKPFSKPVTIGEDVPKRIVEWLEDIDQQGRNIHTFAADLAAEALSHGMSGILVDCPKGNVAKTVAEEAAAGIRPYFVHVHPQNILGWRVAVANGRTYLAQLRLLELVTEPDGEFADKTIEQVRVLEPGSWRTFRKTKTTQGEKWTDYESGTTTLKVIPFVPVYGKRKAFMVGVPPMIELAHANVEHWQSKSDQQTILHVARVPMLFAKLIGDSGITVGAGSFIKSGDEKSDVKYVEHSGKAIEAGRMSILDLEDRMRQTGAELLVIKPGNTTEVQTVADNEQGMCDLQRMIQHIEDAFDQALDLMAAWVGEKDGGHVTIYRDFGAATLAEASAKLLLETNMGGKLSDATLINEYKRRGIVSPEVDTDEEIAQAKIDAPKDVTVTTDVRP